MKSLIVACLLTVGGAVALALSTHGVELEKGVGGVEVSERLKEHSPPKVNMDKSFLRGIRKEREEWNTRTRCLRELLIGDTKDERDKSSTSASGTANGGRATGDCTAKKSSDSASRTSRAVGNP